MTGHRETRRTQSRKEWAGRALVMLALALAPACYAPIPRPLDVAPRPLPDAPRSSLPRTVVLLPPKMRAGMASKPDSDNERLSTRATNFVDAAVHNLQTPFSLVDLPPLSKEETQRVWDHVNLCDYLCDRVYALPYEPWSEIISSLDYSLGDGLAFLAERTGADAALIVVGNSHATTSSERAGVLPSLFVNRYTFPFMLVPEPPVGTCQVIIAIVDLSSGDLIWVNKVRERDQFMVSTAHDLADRSGAFLLVSLAFDPYPMFCFHANQKPNSLE